jgi:hypothetical protein
VAFVDGVIDVGPPGLGDEAARGLGLGAVDHGPVGVAGVARPFPRADEGLTCEAVDEFRTIPEEYQADVLERIKGLARVVRRAAYRIIGGEPEEGAARLD